MPIPEGTSPEGRSRDAKPGSRERSLARVVDVLLPGRGSALDRASLATHQAVVSAVGAPGVRPVSQLLRGNEWLGHPMHPVVIAVPIGAWVVSGWYDLRSAVSRDPRDEHAADGALRIGVAGALVAAVTGIVQYVDTKGAVRRETTVHAALNNVALGLYVASGRLRRTGRRSLARKLALTALGVVGVSGYLGGDISFRHGVGVRPQALRDTDRPASESSDEPIEVSEVRHV